MVVRSIETGGHTDYTPVGHVTNLAARMQTAAPVGSIAVTEATRSLVEGYITLKALGATKVKGLSEPVNVYEVTGLGPLRTRLQRAAARGLTKFVGRRREMDALGHTLQQAKAGHGQIVAAMADPGVGKSRLFYEFKAQSHSGCMVLEAYSVSHGKASAYLPAIELLREYFEIGSETMTASGASESSVRYSGWIVHSKTRCPISTRCLASSNLAIRWRGWIRTSSAAGRWRRSNACSCARA